MGLETLRSLVITTAVVLCALCTGLVLVARAYDAPRTPSTLHRLAR